MVPEVDRQYCRLGTTSVVLSRQHRGCSARQDAYQWHQQLLQTFRKFLDTENLSRQNEKHIFYFTKGLLGLGK